jgi:ribokinase
MAGAVLTLGSVNADFQVRIDEENAAAEMSMARDLCRFGGGKAANLAYLVRRLDHDAWLFGRVGDDDLAEQALAPLREAGVDVSGVSRAAGCQTGFAMVIVPPSGKKRIVLAPDANDSWDDEAVTALCDRIAGAPEGSVLVVDCEVPVSVVKAAVAAATRHGLRTVLDPSFAERVDDELLAAVDAITPNASEARALLGAGNDEAPEDIARALAKRGPTTVCLKLSHGGCLLLHENRPVRIDAARVEVVDSTGAGDAFAGAFAVAWVEGRSTEEAARLGVAASTCAVTRYGAQPSYPTRDELDAMWRRQEGGADS